MTEPRRGLNTSLWALAALGFTGGLVSVRPYPRFALFPTALEWAWP